MKLRTLFVWCLLLISISPSLLAQNANATLSGVVQDPTGAAVVRATIKLKNIQTGTVTQVTSNSEGMFSFPNLPRGDYELSATSDGFKELVQKGISLDLDSVIRIPVTLQVGASQQVVEVKENASPVNFDTPTVKGTITPGQIDQLPVQVSGGQRSAAAFVTLLPGVNGGITGSAASAQFNGGQHQSDEAVMDGVSMTEGSLSQSGVTAINDDFPISPEATGEITVLSSNYDVRYGTAGTAVIVATTRSGTNEFHGSGYYYGRNSAVDAKQWGVTSKSPDLEDDTGFAIGGPVKIPGLYSSGARKTFFFFNFEAYRSAGATVKPLLTVPTDKMRSGDFSEWPYPIYDPTAATRTQFMGCDGTTPNVICPTNPWFATSLASGWLKFVPHANHAGLIANWEPPSGVSSSLGSNTNTIDWRVDHYLNEKHHFYASFYERASLPVSYHLFPEQIDSSGWRYPNLAQTVRFNYDYIISPTLLNHFAAGYLNYYSKGVDAATCCISQVPEIAGVFANNTTPQITFGNGYSTYGATDSFHDNRPTYIYTDDVTWVKGAHQFDFGGDFRTYKFPQYNENNSAGTFNFTGGVTSVLGQVSGNAYADFLLGAVGSASASYYTLPQHSADGRQVALYAGDNWKATRKITLTYGVRWDLYRPLTEEKNRMSFLDPTAANPGAGNLLGTLAFAGSGWGAASFGKPYPEKLYYGAYAPRLGIAYALDSKTAVRLGYGISYMTFTPGWGSAAANDGFNTTAAFSASNAGLTPAFLLQNGVPQTFAKPPFIDPTFLNGQNAPTYRPANANREPYVQQWNFTVEREIRPNLDASVGYVANKGTRLLSQNSPINVLPPSDLALQSKLADTFQPGMTQLDGVSIPYAGWVQQMVACPPSVAQAMLPFPQYCGPIYGINENEGDSTYNSLQAKVEERFSHGLFFMASYTWSKTISDTNSVQFDTSPFSPYEKHRDKSIAGVDIPQIFALSYTYELPFGKGKRFLQTGIADRIAGGWSISGITRFSAGTPLQLTSSYCNLGGATFGASCVPGRISGVNPYVTSRSSWNPNTGALLNTAAFEPASSFNYYWGSGSWFSPNLRSFGYKNFDIGITKHNRIGEHVDLQIRVEAFNAFNEHSFGSGLITDVANPSFGDWNGNVTAPRNLQYGGKITF